MAKLFNPARSLSSVPARYRIALVALLFLQLLWKSQFYHPEIQVTHLPRPWSAEYYYLLSLAEPVVMAKALNHWLQAFDNQAGVSLSYKQLDYDRLTQWLDAILKLDPEGRYPMLSAARIYGSVNDEQRQRIMLEFIYEKFLESPEKHWQWLAHAVLVAQHKLKDLDLALRYADALASHSANGAIPYWAKDMKILVLEKRGEYDAAKILIGGLLANREITDEYEIKFLVSKLADLKAKTSNR